MIKLLKLFRDILLNKNKKDNCVHVYEICGIEPITFAPKVRICKKCNNVQRAKETIINWIDI
ncbi:MAG: hypothetical protein ACD_33C00002G0027 [uncultured bacterium]|nr:MAG: hypothetical protein ACD_33C00002G0027 [uncultured bacterium]